MPPDQPDKQSGPPKGHRRSRSFSMACPREVIDVSDSSETEASGSRKHERPEKDSQVEGPTKRRKQNRGSEPPMRKDTTMTPKESRKKSRKQIDHHKASRTSNHQQLKEKNKTLECELASVRQAHSDTDREHQANLDWHAQESERLQKRYDEQVDKAREVSQMFETAREKIQTLTRKLEDAVNDVQTLQLSCLNKDEEMKGKDEVIAAIQRELSDSKHQSSSLEKSLGKAQLTIKSKDEFIAGLQIEVEGKDEVIAESQRELDNYRQRCSALEASMGEKERELKAAKRDQSDCQKQLALTHEKLRSKEIDLDRTDAALEKSEYEKDALSAVNDGNGHRNYNLRSQAKKAKDALKSLETGESSKFLGMMN